MLEMSYAWNRKQSRCQPGQSANLSGNWRIADNYIAMPLKLRQDLSNNVSFFDSREALLKALKGKSETTVVDS